MVFPFSVWRVSVPRTTGLLGPWGVGSNAYFLDRCLGWKGLCVLFDRSGPLPLLPPPPMEGGRVSSRSPRSGPHAGGHWVHPLPSTAQRRNAWMFELQCASFWDAFWADLIHAGSKPLSPKRGSHFHRASAQRDSPSGPLRL